MRVGLKAAARFAQKEHDGFRVLERRLYAEHELEVLTARVVPGDAAFRLEKHGVV